MISISLSSCKDRIVLVALANSSDYHHRRGFSPELMPGTPERPANDGGRDVTRRGAAKGAERREEAIETRPDLGSLRLMLSAHPKKRRDRFGYWTNRRAALCHELDVCNCPQAVADQHCRRQNGLAHGVLRRREVDGAGNARDRDPDGRNPTEQHRTSTEPRRWNRPPRQYEFLLTPNALPNLPAAWRNPEVAASTGLPIMDSPRPSAVAPTPENKSPQRFLSGSGGKPFFHA